MDRSGRTYEEYRQLYWDEKARRKELQAQLADAEKTRIAIAHIRDKKSTEARHRYEAAEAQLDNRQKEHDLARNNWMKMYEDVKAQLDDRDMLYEAGITAARKEIEGLQAQLANYQKNWHCKCGGWSEPEMKHCQFCGGLRKDTWYAKRIEDLQAQLANDTKLIAMLTQVVEDFLPNIGKCALQDYGKLNTALCLSGERLQAITGDKK